MSEESVESSGVEQTAGAASPEQASPQPTQEAGVEHDASTQAVTQEKQAPFHEHPRFKELVQQKNEYARQMQEYAQQMQTMQQRLAQFENTNKPGPQVDPLIAELKQLNPAFAERFEKLTGMEKEVSEFRQWRAQQEQRDLATQVTSKLDSLYKSSNVPDNLKDMYQAQIKSAVYEMEAGGKKLGLSDLEHVFKTTHDNLSKFMDTYNRQIRESYVTDKKKDQTPATQTGGSPAAPRNASGKFTSKDDVKAAVAKFMRGSQEKI